MKSDLPLRLCLLAPLLVTANAAYAQAPATSLDTCNGCTALQVEARAEQRHAWTMERVFVLDYLQRTAWQCDVYYEQEFNANIAACGPAAQEVQQTFFEMTDSIISLNGEVEIPYDGGSIYDISGCPACARGWLLDNQGALVNQLSLIDLLSAAGLRFAGQIGVSVGSVSASYEGQVRVKVTLENDSSGGREKGYCIGYLTGTELMIDVNQCVDSDGNPIPTLQNTNVQNRYAFTSTFNHSSMVNRLRAVGRTIYTGTVTTGPLEIECTGDECITPPPGDDDGS